MPALRLPWVKLWVESLEHEKVALLPDGTYRTWVALLLRASQQPVRWRFASVEHAAVVAGRPVAHVVELIAARLLDDGEDGLWIHDASRWQDVHPSDYTPRRLREDSAKTPYQVRRERDRERDGDAPAVEGGRGVESLIESLTPARDVVSPVAEATGYARARKTPRVREETAVLEARGDGSAPSSRALPKTTKYGEVIDRIHAAGLPYTGEPRDAAAVKRSQLSASQLVEVYSALATGEYGDDWQREHLCLATAAAAWNAYQTSLAVGPSAQARGRARRNGQQQTAPRSAVSRVLAFFAAQDEARAAAVAAVDAPQEEESQHDQHQLIDAEWRVSPPRP